MHYLDNAATTEVSAEAADIAAAVLTRHFANPSSLYAIGAHSEDCLNKSRAAIARAMGADVSEVIFTASGSEGNNIAILGAVKARRKWGRHIVATAYEHPSVQLCVEALAKEGVELTLITPEKDGNVDINKIINAVTDKTMLVTAMHVNNETGAYIDAAALGKAVKAKNSRTAVHIDGVQAFCKLPFSITGSGIDSYSVSGHKIHAPKGIGALYLRKGYNIEPVLFGGGQERGMRPGTENIAFAAAFAKAAELANADLHRQMSHVEGLNSFLWKELSYIPDIIRNSPPDAVCGIANFSVANIKSETMLHFLESRDIFVSGGSACSKGAKSHTLSAMGLDDNRIDTALRISIGAYNTEDDITALISSLKDGIATLAKIKR
ncbi:MAG: cysteine desulfurase family protein [Oscillospiraceae bacterium]